MRLSTFVMGSWKDGGWEEGHGVMIITVMPSYTLYIEISSSKPWGLTLYLLSEIQ